MNCVEKRDLLYSDKSPAELAKIGESLLAGGARYDALQFFLRADDQSGLSKIRQSAIEEGDAFMLEQFVLSGREIEAAEWRSLADNARRLQKFQFAIRALRAAGDDVAADKLAEEAGLTEPAADEAESSPEAGDGGA